MRNYHHRSTHVQRARQNEQNNGEISPEEIQRNRERAQRGLNKYIAKYKEHMAQQAAISQPGDDNEKEADEEARKVSEGDEKQVDISTPPQGNNIQRNADEEEVMPKSEEEPFDSAQGGEVMPSHEEKEESLMAKGEGGGLHATEELQARLDTNKGGGQAMDDKTRGEMESKMGADLGDVKIHTGTEAHDMAEGINAKAFTYGQDVYFKNGNYNPSSKEGKNLLAHELTHTQQQKGASVGRMIQRFGAKSHERVESNALSKGTNDQKFSASEIKNTYYGNWTRDFNQLMTPGGLTEKIGVDGMFSVLSLMSAYKFGKMPSLSEFGYYNPKEHIDNPAGIYPDKDMFTTPPSLKIPGLDNEKRPQLTDPTPQANVNADKDSNSFGKTELGAEMLSVDQTGVMSYIRDSNVHVERRLKLAVSKGRSEEGLFHLGVALHAVEDLFAHSNFSEIALSKLLADEPTLLKGSLPEKDREVFTYSPTAWRTGKDGKTGNRPVLTTGTFTFQDSKISIASELVDFLTAFDPSRSSTTKLNDITEQGFVNVLLALSKRPEIEAILQENISKALQTTFEVAAVYQAAKKFFHGTTVYEAYLNLKEKAKDLGTYLNWLTKLVSGYDLQTLVKMLLKIIAEKAIKWLLEEAKQMAEGLAVENEVANTPLLEEKKRLTEQLKKEEKMVKKQKESQEEFDKRKKSTTGVTQGKIDQLSKLKTAELSGPSHSQIAKDHPDSIFFGLAFQLANEADRLIRDKIVEAWGPGQNKSKGMLGSFSELGEMLNMQGLQKEAQAIMTTGHMPGQQYDPEKVRKETVAKLKLVRLYCRMEGHSQKSKARELDTIGSEFSKGADELSTLDLFDYNARLNLYTRLMNQAVNLHKIVDRKYESKRAEYDYNPITDPYTIKMAPIYEAISFLAPAFTPEQKQNIKNAHTGKTEELRYAEVTLPSIDKEPPAVKLLLETSRDIINHPYDTTWWKDIVKNFILDHPQQVVTEIKMKNAGYTKVENPYKGK